MGRKETRRAVEETFGQYHIYGCRWDLLVPRASIAAFVPACAADLSVTRSNLIVTIAASSHHISPRPSCSTMTLLLKRVRPVILHPQVNLHGTVDV